ncbi:mucin-5AC-like isoform X1 [Festucalex cinctus]
MYAANWSKLETTNSVKFFGVAFQATLFSIVDIYSILRRKPLAVEMTHPVIKWLGVTLVLLHAGIGVQATSNECWTRWFDRDNPSGTGDYETLPELHKENPDKICQYPIQIEVKTKSGASVGSTGDVIHVSDTRRGFICKISDQPKGYCADYQVRFLCPLEFCQPEECWTPFFDRDDPSRTGDYETLSDLHKENPGKICDHPIKIEVKTKSGDSVGSTGDVIHVSDVHTGFVCRNQDQPNNGQCSDYKVRFLCPLQFCKAKECWTRWFDRDNPSGTGDYETLPRLHKENPSKICDHPITIEVKTKSGAFVGSTGDAIRVADAHNGFICKNVDQPNGDCADYKVRFLCPLDFCEPKGCWTPWFDRDNPSGTGDYETLTHLRKANPSKICDQPMKIDVKTKSGASAGSTGDVIHASDTRIGFICRNRDQPHNGRCADYQVRFLCPLEFCDAEVCTTPWYDRDNPSGTGDYETLKKLYVENPNEICKPPLGIEVQTVAGNSVASTGGCHCLHGHDYWFHL